jgi:predicted negative regulator of RcsB-dependent stress response
MDDPIQPRAQEPAKKSIRLGWLAIVLIILLIAPLAGMYAWRVLYNPCEVEAVKEASTFLTTQLKTYDGVYQVASTGSPTSVEYPVNTLKQIFMDTQELAVPACMETAKQELVNYMGTVILAFQAYRDGKADATIRELIRQSDTQYSNFKAELRSVNQCAPFCFR